MYGGKSHSGQSHSESKRVVADSIEGRTWVAKLKSPPVDGKANKELIALIAEQFGCSKGAVCTRLGFLAGQAVKDRLPVNGIARPLSTRSGLWLIFFFISFDGDAGKVFFFLKKKYQICTPATRHHISSDN